MAGSLDNGVCVAHSSGHRCGRRYRTWRPTRGRFRAQPAGTPRITAQPGGTLWYAAALLAVPATALALALVVFAPPDACSATWRSAIVRGLLRQTASGFATTNLWAETAWTGFVQARLQARLQARRGGLPAAVGTAALFTRQHLPLLAVTGSGVELAVIRPVGFALAIPFRALVAWRYTRPGGVCLVGLLHAAGDAAAVGVGGALLTRLYPHHNVALFPIGVEGLIGRAVLAGTRARLGLPARAARPVSTKTVRARSRV